MDAIITRRPAPATSFDPSYGVFESPEAHRKYDTIQKLNGLTSAFKTGAFRPSDAGAMRGKWQTKISRQNLHD
jgi:hypothetical protein